MEAAGTDLNMACRAVDSADSECLANSQPAAGKQRWTPNAGPLCSSSLSSTVKFLLILGVHLYLRPPPALLARML